MTAVEEIFRELVSAADRHGESAVRAAIQRFRRRRERAQARGRTATKRKKIRPQWVSQAFHRQRGICPRCEEPMSMTERDRRLRVTGDHIEPISTGGAHTAANIAAMHQHCNAAKGNRTMYEDCKATGQSLQRRIALIEGVLP